MRPQEEARRARRAGRAQRPVERSTTATLMEADPKLGKLMKEKGPIDPERDRRGSRPDPYEALARAIVRPAALDQGGGDDLGAGRGAVRRRDAVARSR